MTERGRFYTHAWCFMSFSENEPKFDESRLEYLCFFKNHLIFEFCEWLLLKNDFNINISHYMCNFSLKQKYSMGIHDVIFFLREANLYISRLSYFSFVNLPQKSSNYARKYTVVYKNSLNKSVYALFYVKFCFIKSIFFLF